MADFISNLDDGQVVAKFLFDAFDEETGELYLSPNQNWKPRIDTFEVAVHVARRIEARFLEDLEKMADNERQRRYQEGCEQLEEEERVGNRARKGFAGVVGMPDEESRRALLMSYMEGRPQEENIDYDLLAKLTKGMNCSDIEAMVNTVSIRAALKFAKISCEALAEQAKTQRRSVYIPDDDEETMKSAIGKKHVIGFANYQDKDVRL